MSLHAPPCGGDTLIARNPVVYLPNQAIALCAVQFREAAAEAAVLADPTDDLPAARAIAERLGAKFGVEPLICMVATRAAFGAALASASLLHFQGHSYHAPERPLASRVNLADGGMSAADIVADAPSPTRLAVLAGSESGSVQVGAGEAVGRHAATRSAMA